MKVHRLRAHPYVMVAAFVLLLPAFSVSVVPHPVHAQGATSRALAQPGLGWLTVRPKTVRVGETLTVSGRTHGVVQFLPPAVIAETVASRTIDAGAGPCGGKQQEPVASYALPGGGAGGPHTRKNPPVGTNWSMKIKIPASMFHPAPNGKNSKIPTPLGAYRVAAVGVGLDYCSLPAKSNNAFTLGRFTIVR